ncbi:hypothetical protein BC826DRAFT_969479 [Russula brevipes]|nr:hypothetical protein BC826DRAFT_969479 [Russula brevipes]
MTIAHKKPRLRAKGKGKEKARGKSSIVEERTAEASYGDEKEDCLQSSWGNDGGREEKTRPACGRRVTRRGAAGQASRNKKSSDGSRLQKKEDESRPRTCTRKQERAKRIEYFKQLDGYELPKENVYRLDVSLVCMEDDVYVPHSSDLGTEFKVSGLPALWCESLRVASSAPHSAHRPHDAPHSFGETMCVSIAVDKGRGQMEPHFKSEFPRVVTESTG